MEQRHGQLFTTNLTLPLWNINVNDAAHTSHNTNYLRNSFVKIMYGEFGRTGLNKWGIEALLLSFSHSFSHCPMSTSPFDVQIARAKRYIYI